MKKHHVIIIHSVFWVMFVILPMLMFRLDDFRHGPDLSFFLHQTILNFIVFYMVYLLLIPLVIRRRKLADLVWISLVFIVIMTLARVGFHYLMKEVLGIWEGHPFSFERQALREFFMTLMYTFYPLVIYFSIEWFRERQYRFELTREKQKSEIALLKSQVNPHFLMNTLNNLYSLVYQGSKQANEAVLKLSEIMRYMLYETDAPLVPLESEIKYLKSFIELQLLRFRSDEFEGIRIEGDPSGRMIAPMLLIPFVENAFKHGLKRMPGKAISITLTIEEKRIIFEVHNLKAPGSAHKNEDSGIGLANVRKRLELQYPGKHLLETDEGTDYFKVRLILEG